MSEKGCCSPAPNKPRTVKVKNSSAPEKQCCCCSVAEPITKYDLADHWITGELETEKGKVPVVSTRLSFKDKFGAFKVRFNIGRMKYQINPGLYAVGNPDSHSPVMVSANYKLTFDSLRKELDGLNCWIMILDTKGINVWCAAGKGTFGTAEIINRIEKTKLSEIVSHKKLILPQLGAPGVSAHEITKQTGFTVAYGPVRACDIKAFLQADYKATDEMRKVKFTMRDRLVLTPVEFITAAKTVLFILGIIFVVNLFAARPFVAADLLTFAAAMVTGTIITPVLLPFIPGKAFALKGWLLGLIVTACMVWLNGWFAVNGVLLAIGYLLVLPSYSAFLAMNFTGSSTYTSFSGVLKEMKISIPPIIISIVVGCIVLLVKAFMR
ncbi:MAG: dehydrogenase/acetyl-CoA synthase gamma subunit (corrinoid Fe-S protein)-like protein [Oscillospiraceae bacterium]|jgi:hypothetical protein|nr:dehydrogenase/acetyl-CoA synthase gamma subunit (corrinoid Fe-S protein)-like protein [Oscillospiraceae bacterium]